VVDLGGARLLGAVWGDPARTQASFAGPFELGGAGGDLSWSGSWLVAAGDARIGGGMPRRINPGAAGVIDRSVPKSGSAAGTPEGNLTQFNRIPDTSNFAGAAGTAGIAGTTGQAALPDLDGGPVLYTIMERPAPQQARPVLYKPANAAQPSSKGSAKRYCTVTEVLRSTAACQ